MEAEHVLEILVMQEEQMEKIQSFLQSHQLVAEAVELMIQAPQTALM